jgi:predicted outer membrane protein
MLKHRPDLSGRPIVFPQTQEYQRMIFQHIATALSCVLFVSTLLPCAENSNQPQERTAAKEVAKENVATEDSHLTDALAQWLVNGNKAEIELGKLASEKASSPEVKEFAQMMVKDHSAYLAKVQKFTDEKGQPVAGADRKTFETTPVEEKRPAIEEDAKIGDAKEQKVGFRGDKHAAMEKIGKRAGEIHLQMTKDLLNKYQGRDFDMAYVGQQIAAHTQMLANLKAMEENTSGEFQTVVKEGLKTTEMHLNHAKEISAQLQKQGGGQAGDRGRTEPREPRSNR